MTEDQLEQEALGWLADVGYTHRYGLDIAPDGDAPERAAYTQTLLPFRLREAIHRLNPQIPTSAREDALKQVMELGVPALLAANRQFHKLLVNGVPVQYLMDGETRGDFVRLIDWERPDRNDLDGQLFGVFSLAQDLLREQPVQATTRQELRALLGNRPSGGIVFATIQKFMPGEDEDVFPLLSDRHNIVVIADEAHRTQYGFEAKLKIVKPRAIAAATANDAQALLWRQNRWPVIRWATLSICAMPCPMPPSWPLPARRCPARTPPTRCVW